MSSVLLNFSYVYFSRTIKLAISLVVINLLSLHSMEKSSPFVLEEIGFSDQFTQTQWEFAKGVNYFCDPKKSASYEGYVQNHEHHLKEVSE